MSRLLSGGRFCVDRFDHHCNVMDNCIARRARRPAPVVCCAAQCLTPLPRFYLRNSRRGNHAYFAGFLLCACASSALLAIASGLQLQRLDFPRRAPLCPAKLSWRPAANTKPLPDRAALAPRTAIRH